MKHVAIFILFSVHWLVGCDSSQQSRVGKRSGPATADAEATSDGSSVDGLETVVVPETVASTQPTPTPSSTPAVTPAKIYLADVGVKSFLQINATMSVLTGVPKSRDSVAAEFDKVKSQLPTTNDAASFSGTSQGAIAKLAIAYCDAAIEDAALRANLIPGFNFAAANLSTAFSPAMKDLAINSLTEKFWGSDLRANPDIATTKAILNPMLDALVAGGLNGQSVAVRTRNIVKGLCTAVLASSSVTML